MINTLTYFDTEKDLRQLTGLTHDQLWIAGFNLDDWDVGFVTEGLPVEKEPSEWDETKMVNVLKWWNNDVPAFVGNLLSQWENYCVGYKIVEHGGKQYFMLYHA